MSPAMNRPCTGRRLLLGTIAAGILGAALGAGRMGMALAQDHMHEHMPVPLAAPPGQVPTESIYNLDSAWRDQDGRRAALDTLRGTPRVVAMIYTSCQYVCPLIVDEMQQVERALSAGERAQVGFALFSFDPERDSVGALKAYAAKRSLDESRWRLYTGAADDVLDLAAVLGMRIRMEPDGEFSHSTIVTVLDREGLIRYQMLGLGQDRAALLAAVRAVLKR